MANKCYGTVRISLIVYYYLFKYEANCYVNVHDHYFCILVLRLTGRGIDRKNIQSIFKTLRVSRAWKRYKRGTEPFRYKPSSLGKKLLRDELWEELLYLKTKKGSNFPFSVFSCFSFNI